ncbi:hypothetical protein RJ639_009581 [Escallonia herrerae]|uniref:Uncharacterized protein n=1 Tax=Escallonia herrerae TaxID=1293975 RepID=A0AA88VR78_9ASTE|nr:hypothetical protein RJ639_017516 [Escallonia herrerae]KAK3013585.1 hypothetical protein RJ639_009581 [Escallonia herrerae]
MNVIACEGAERIERPETYKQWQVRNLRAGFRQLPLNDEILDMIRIGKVGAKILVAAFFNGHMQTPNAIPAIIQPQSL